MSATTSAAKPGTAKTSTAKTSTATAKPTAGQADPVQQLTLGQYARVVLRAWSLTAACALAGLVAAGGYLAVTTPTYSARASVIVTATLPADQVSNLGTVAFYMERRLPTYAVLARSSIVLQPVLDQLKLPGTPAELARTITATQPDGFAGLSITVTGPDPVRAAAVANAVAQTLPGKVAGLENPATARLAAVQFKQQVTATVPEHPLRPQRGPFLVLGALLGTTVGLLLVGVRQARRRTLAGVADVEDVTGEPPVARIPFSRTAGRHLIGEIDQDAFQVLAQRLTLVFPPPGGVLAVVSSTHGEGRTTVAANLAFALVRAGFSVVLVDAAATDSPDGLRRRLGLERGAGLAAVLRGHASYPAAVVTPPLAPGLRVLPGGIDNPGHELSSRAMVALLKDLAGSYDYVVVDGQPLAGGRAGDSIGTAIAGMADAALVVARAGLTTTPGLRRTHRALELLGTRSLGVALNRASPAVDRPESAGYSEAGLQDLDHGQEGKT